MYMQVLFSTQAAWHWARDSPVPAEVEGDRSQEVSSCAVLQLPGAGGGVGCADTLSTVTARKINILMASKRVWMFLKKRTRKNLCLRAAPGLFGCASKSEREKPSASGLRQANMISLPSGSP
jgi:hypothetical protein